MSYQRARSLATVSNWSEQVVSDYHWTQGLGLLPGSYVWTNLSIIVMLGWCEPGISGYRALWLMTSDFMTSTMVHFLIVIYLLQSQNHCKSASMSNWENLFIFDISQFHKILLTTLVVVYTKSPFCHINKFIVLKRFRDLAAMCRECWVDITFQHLGTFNRKTTKFNLLIF